LKRKFRLTRYNDFVRVRKNGRSVTHPLVVLVYQANSLSFSRFGVAANHHLGNAVQRNIVKRRLRTCLHGIYLNVKPGWDIALLARKPVVLANYRELDQAIERLLQKADLIIDNTDLYE